MTPEYHAIEVYKAAYEALCELSQSNANDRRKSNKYGRRAVIALRALRAESRPLSPMLPAPTRVCCLQCAAYLAAPAELKPVPLEEAFL